MVYDKAIKIQIIDELTEEWTDLYKLHARVNKKSGSENVDAGAVRSKVTKNFDVRYFEALQRIEMNTQLYRIVYKNVFYNIVDYDDFMESHRIVRLVGESY